MAHHLKAIFKNKKT